MATKTLIIKKITRLSAIEPDESLTFKSGVNVIVGVPNTGKTKWLQMLDYLMGDPGKPEKAFEKDLAEKYHAINAEIEIDGETFLLERRWNAAGLKNKTLVNDEPKSSKEFSDFLLSKLQIPLLHFPKGNPYRGTWPRLSWRILLRHIYRQQRFWSSFADKQPETEQVASLFQFLGIAENLFSAEYGQLVEKRKKVSRREGAKDTFINMLNEISKEVLTEKEIQVGITAQSVDDAIKRLQGQIQQKQHERKAKLQALLDITQADKTLKSSNQFENLGEHWANLQLDKEKNLLHLKTIKHRLQELQDYKDTINDERQKIDRTRAAANVLVDLKVTHCPACDQSIKTLTKEADNCFLCKQPVDEKSIKEQSIKRIEFEIDHLEMELKETDELINDIVDEQAKTQHQFQQIEEEIERVEVLLHTVRQASASVISPEISVLDITIGSLQERIKQLERIKSTLDLRQKLSNEIATLNNEIIDLENQVNLLSKRINFEQSSDLLSDGMTTYLNQLEINRRLWTQGPPKWKLKKNDFNVTISDSEWSIKLGGTLTLYFLISYHYALFSLTNNPNCHYPGLLILDLPAKLEDGSKISTQENFILEPFINLVAQPTMQNTQVIVTGEAFKDLKSVHRNELNRVWK